MSWEKENQSECSCPCGHGRIFQDHYSDDWNRFRSSSPIIDCAECREKYHVETFSWHTCDGEYCSTHYCVSNDYPQYKGSEYRGKYSGGFSINEVNFTEYLVETYSKKTLEDVLMVLIDGRTYRNIEDKGIGTTTRKIIRSYKSFYKTQRISIIINEVKLAIDKYFKYECRFDTLEKARLQYEVYKNQKKKDSILLNL